MNLSVGIVGFPNVGKSTLFSALRQCSGYMTLLEKQMIEYFYDYFVR